MTGCRVTSISCSGVRQVLIRLRLARTTACRTLRCTGVVAVALPAGGMVTLGRLGSVSVGALVSGASRNSWSASGAISWGDVMPRPPPSVGRPVIVKKTSSRLGRCRDSSVTPMPAACSRATVADSASSPSTATLSASRPVSVTGFELTRPRAWRTSSSRLGSLGRTVRRWPPTVRLSPSGVSWAMTRPRSMTVISSARASASSRYWVVSSTVEPSVTSRRTTSHIASRLAGSRPVVGSSRKTIAGRPTRDAARSRRRRMPPE